MGVNVNRSILSNEDMTVKIGIFAPGSGDRKELTFATEYRLQRFRAFTEKHPQDALRG